MSSQTWLYPIFCVQGYRVHKVETDEQRLLLHIEPQPDKVCCPKCGSREVIRRGEHVRWFRNLPVGGDCTWLLATLPRVECRSCRIVRQIRSGLADERRTYTLAFERYVLELSRYMTIKDVASHLGVSWDIVKDIQKRNLQQHYAEPALQGVRQIAIDEICVGRGYRFLTLVLDLESGAILFVGKGKKADSLRPFWRRMRAARPRSRPSPSTSLRPTRRRCANTSPRPRWSSTGSMSSSC